MTSRIEDLIIAEDFYVVNPTDPRIYYGYVRNVDGHLHFMSTAFSGGCPVDAIDSIDVTYSPIAGKTLSSAIPGNHIIITTTSGERIQCDGRLTFFNLRLDACREHRDNGDRAVHVKFENLRDFAHVFSLMVPDIADKFKRDALFDRKMIHTSVLRGNVLKRKGDGFVAVCDDILPMWYLYIDEVLDLNAGYHKKVPTVLADQFLSLLCNREVNSFSEWLESLEWDGIERVDGLWRWMFGATTDGRLDVNDEDDYLSAVAWDWLSGAVARQYSPVQLDMVPIFIGDAGIGKTTLIKDLLPGLVTSTDLDFKDIRPFFDATRGNVLVELGEGAIFDTQSPERLKNFISKESDTYRRPYDRFEVDHNRHWVLFVTSNRRMLLNDATGNRRYYPIYCDSEHTLNVCDGMDPAERAQYFEQIWAEVYNRVRELDFQPTHYARDIKTLSRAVQQTAEFDDPLLEAIDNALAVKPIGCRVNRDGITVLAFGRNAMLCTPKELDAVKNWINSRVGIGKEWIRCNSSNVIGSGGYPTKSRGFEKIANDVLNT